MVHDPNVRVLAAQFRVHDDEPDRPVRHAAQYHEQDETGEEASLAHCVG